MHTRRINYTPPHWILVIIPQKNKKRRTEKMKNGKILCTVLFLISSLLLMPFAVFAESYDSMDSDSASRTDAISGIKFIVNDQYGLFLQNESSIICSTSSLPANNFSSEKWSISWHSDGYVFHPNNAAGDQYLAVTIDGSGLEIISSNSSRSYPERCVWSCIRCDEGYIIIGQYRDSSNHLVQKILSFNGSTLYLSNYTSSFSRNQIWHFIDYNYSFGSLSCWYDEETNRIGYWDSNPSKILGMESDSISLQNFNSIWDTACSQWENALEIDFQTAFSADNSDLILLAGSHAYLEEAYGTSFPSNYIGITLSYYSLDAFLYKDGKVFFKNKMDFGASAVFVREGASLDAYKKTDLDETSNVALFGNGARNTIKGGTGSGDVNTRSNMNIEDGLKEALDSYKG